MRRLNIGLLLSVWLVVTLGSMGCDELLRNLDREQNNADEEFNHNNHNDQNNHDDHNSRNNHNSAANNSAPDVELEHELRAGDFIQGVNDVWIHASEEALEEPISVGLAYTKPENTEVDLPEPLRMLDGMYFMQTEGRVDAPNSAYFAVSFPVPENTNAEDLVVAFWMDPDDEFMDRNNDDTLQERSGYWAIADSELIADESRVMATFYMLDDKPRKFLLAQGPWINKTFVIPPTFLEDGEFYQNGELDQRRQPLLTANDLHINCEGLNTDYCSDDVIREYAFHLLKAINYLGSEGFVEPRLRTTLTGNLKFYLKEQRESGGILKLCRHYPNDEGGFRINNGRYNGFLKKSTTCIWPQDQRAPTVHILEAVEGQSYIVRIDGVDYGVVAQPDDTPESIAQAIAAQIRAASSLHTLFEGSFPAEARGDRISLNYRFPRPNIPNVSVLGSANDTISLYDAEYRNSRTAVHEYFHALQRGAKLTGLPQVYLEGTAVASERSRRTMERNPLRALRPLDTPLFRDNSDADKYDYQAQDFFVYAGQRASAVYAQDVGIRWLLPMMSDGGTIPAIQTALQRIGLGLGAVYWDYARNQFLEKTHTLDSLTDEMAEKCTVNTDLFENTSQAREVEIDENLNENMSLRPFSAGYIAVNIPSTADIQSWIIEVSSDNNIATKIYRHDYEEDESCQLRYRDMLATNSSTAINDDRTIYVFAANTSTSTTEEFVVTARRSTTTIEFGSENDAQHPAGQNFEVVGNYVAEHLPATVHLYLNDELIDSQTVTEPSGTVRSPIRLCGVDSHVLRYEIVDAGEAVGSADKTVDIIESGDQLFIASEDILIRGNVGHVPVSLAGYAVEPFELKASTSSCSDSYSPEGWRWRMSLPDGVYRGDVGEILSLNDEVFRGADEGLHAVSLTLNHIALNGQSTLLLQPCAPGISRDLPSCPSQNQLDLYSDQFELYREIAYFRDNEAAIMTADQRIFEAFGELLPSELPMSMESLHREISLWIPDESVSMPLKMLADAFYAHDVDSFMEEFQAAMAASGRIENDAHAHLMTGLFMGIATKLHRYNHFDQGGMAGHYELPGQYDQSFDPLRPAQNAFRYAMTAWIDAFQNKALDYETMTMDDLSYQVVERRATTAGFHGGLRGALQQSTDFEDGRR